MQDSAIQDQATFNMATATIERMNNLLKDINLHARSGMLIPWMFDLDQLYKEVIYFVKKKPNSDALTKKRKEVKEIYKDFKKKIIEHKIYPKTQEFEEDLMEFFDRVLALKFPFIQDTVDKLDEVLDEFEIKIRMNMGVYKLLMPDKSDPRFAFGKGSMG